MYWNLIWKSPRFVQFRDNLTHWTQIGSPWIWAPVCPAKPKISPQDKLLWLASVTRASTARHLLYSLLKSSAQRDHSALFSLLCRPAVQMELSLTRLAWQPPVNAHPVCLATIVTVSASLKSVDFVKKVSLFFCFCLYDPGLKLLGWWTDNWFKSFHQWPVGRFWVLSKLQLSFS